MDLYGSDGLSPPRRRGRNSLRKNGSLSPKVQQNRGTGGRRSSGTFQVSKSGGSQSMSPMTRKRLVDYSQKPAQDVRQNENDNVSSMAFKTAFASSSMSDLDYWNANFSDSNSSSSDDSDQDNADQSPPPTNRPIMFSLPPTPLSRSHSPKRTQKNRKKKNETDQPADVKLHFRIRNPNVAPKPATPTPPPKPAILLSEQRRRNHELHAIGEEANESASVFTDSKSSLQHSALSLLSEESATTLRVSNNNAVERSIIRDDTNPAGSGWSQTPPPPKRGGMNLYGTAPTSSLEGDSADDHLDHDANCGDRGNPGRKSMTVDDLRKFSRQNSRGADEHDNNGATAAPPPLPEFERAQSAATTSSNATPTSNRLVASAMFAVQELPPSTIRQQKKLQREIERSSNSPQGGRSPTRVSGTFFPVSIEVSPSRRQLRRTKSTESGLTVVPTFAGGGSAPRRKVRRSKSSDDSSNFINIGRRRGGMVNVADEEEEEEDDDDHLLIPVGKAAPRASMATLLDGRLGGFTRKGPVRRSKSGETATVGDVTDQLRRRADDDGESSNQSNNMNPSVNKSVARMGGTRIKRFASREDREGGLSGGTTSGGKELRRLINESKRTGVLG